MSSILDLQWEARREGARLGDALGGPVARALPPAVRGYLHRVPQAFAERQAVNVNRFERVASVLLGAALIGYGLLRSAGGRSVARPALVAAAGGALVERGLSGRCALYRALHLTSA
jgi:hypothetical protein